MRRWLTRIVICLLLGAVTTVAVAWGLACIFWDTTSFWSVTDRGGYMGDPLSADVGFVDRQRLRHEARMPKGVLPDNFGVTGAQNFAFDVVTFETVLPKGYGKTAVVRIGWPIRGQMAHHGIMYRGDDGTWIQDGPEWGFGSLIQNDERLNPWAPVLERWIPWAPVWPGFLIDTLFYGALWLGLLVGFGAARRGLRKKHGRCPTCAYDLRGDLDNGCPECGWNRAEAES